MNFPLDIQYVGEHLLPGRVGHFLVILAFISAILAAIGYYKATQNRNTDQFESWRSIGRLAFLTHGLSIFSIIGLMFFIMISQMYEYQYAWDHVSDDLPMKYIFSAFWEGQEGSFLLWMFWHIILGIVLIFKKGKWESPTMAVLASVEIVLISMIVGVYFGDDFKFGSSPFLLLRDTMAAPIFNNAEYLSMIEGTGLNPLLQNYWMTIHPPTLFLGFASTTIPFCFAIAGLWLKEHTAWLKPVLPWALFCGGILGTGILMGGAWAYEALSFGGYWAWDPVENMSLVPWIILIAGVHSNLIANATGQAIRASYIFYMLSFIMIVYSTFLTRSGILGDESVHAFTEMGLEWQLVGFIFIFLGLGTYLFLKNYKNIPSPAQEEKTHSREFWMFIGTLVLMFSAVLITFTTSIPVYNKIFDGVGFLIGQNMEHLHRSMPVDPEPHFNKYQIWIAIFIAFLSCVAQIMRYKGLNWDKYNSRFWSNIVISAVGAILLSLLITSWIDMYSWQNNVLLAAGSFALISNLDYIIRFAKGNWKLTAAAISHLGFAIMLIGILSSGTNKKVISINEFAQTNLLDEVDPRRNIILIKGEPTFMQDYWVTYQDDTINSFTRTFNVDYRKINEKGDTTERFRLSPNVLYEKGFSKVAASNPDTRHYLHKDIFSYIHALPAAQMDASKAKSLDSQLVFTTYEVSPGDTIVGKKSFIVIENFNLGIESPEYKPQPGDLGFSMDIKTKSFLDTIWHKANPGLVIRQALLYRFPDKINDLNMQLELPDESINSAFTPESELKYQNFALKKGDSKIIDGLLFTLKGHDQNAMHINYTPEEGDIAIHADMEVSKVNIGGQVAQENKSTTLKPLFLIRGNTPYNFKDYAPSLRTHLRFIKIDPATETFHFTTAIEKDEPRKMQVRIAENSPRDDLIVLEILEFPGINLFWLGTIMMMIGFFISMVLRWKK